MDYSGLQFNGTSIRPWDLALRGFTAKAIDSGSMIPSPELALDGVIRRHVRYVVDLNRGNKLRAARQLGISRSTLYRILEQE